MILLNQYRFGAASFVPTDVTGLKVWLQADNLGLANDDPVSTWTDLSGNSNDFTSTTTLRPLYKTNIQNGKAVVRFDGTDDFMEKASPAGLDGGTGLTIFIVARHPITTNRTYLAKWDYSTQGSWAFQTNATANLQMYVASSLTDTGGSHNTSTNAALTNAFYLMEMVYDGSQGTNANRVKFYKNTALVTAVSTTGTLGTSLISCTATLKMGKFGGSLTRYFNDDFGEVLIYDSALSDVNRASIETYLNTRWAVY